MESRDGCTDAGCIFPKTPRAKSVPKDEAGLLTLYNISCILLFPQVQNQNLSLKAEQRLSKLSTLQMYIHDFCQDATTVETRYFGRYILGLLR